MKTTFIAWSIVCAVALFNAEFLIVESSDKDEDEANTIGNAEDFAGILS